MISRIVIWLVLLAHLMSGAAGTAHLPKSLVPAVPASKQLSTLVNIAQAAIYLGAIEVSTFGAQGAAGAATTDPTCLRTVDTAYANLSKAQDAELATCDIRKDCDKLIANVTDGRTTQLTLVRGGQLPAGLAGAMDLQGLGVKLATQPGYRAQVAQAITAAYNCQQDKAKCDAQSAQIAVGLGLTVFGGGAAATLIASIPKIAAAAGVAIEGCLANLVLCANQAGIIGAEFLAENALGGAAVAAGIGAVGKGAVKGAGAVAQEANAVNVAVHGGPVIPAGFKPFELEGLPVGSKGVVDVATGEIKVVSATGQLTDIPFTPIPASIQATVVPQANTGIKWGGGIQDQGLPFEDYLAKTLPADTRLPPNFKTFDFFDRETGVATSAKTLDTMTTAKVIDPPQIYASIKANVDDAVNFSGSTLLGVPLNPVDINTRVLQIAIPSGTTPAQWAQIQRAIQYGQANGVIVKITVVN